MSQIKTITVDGVTYDLPGSDIIIPVPITQGGTGASVVATARTNLGLGTAATYASTTFAPASHTHDYSKVSASRAIASGTVLGTITVTNNGTTTTTTINVANASSTTAGITKVGASGGAAAYDHTHSNYLTVDEKVKQDPLTTSATFPLVIKGTSATASVTGTVGFTTVIFSNPNKGNITVKGPANSSSASGAAFRVIPTNGNTTVATLMNYEEGTASSVGTGAVVIGNAVASGNEGNAKGMVIIYGPSTTSSKLTSAASGSSKEQVFPNKAGWVAIGGNGSSSGEGSVSTPIYMKADGELSPVTSIDASLISGDIGDEKVKQTVVSSGTSKYPILTKASTATTTVTGEAKFGANLYAMPANAVIAAYGVTGAATDNGSGFAVRNSTDVKTVAKLYAYQDGTSTSVGAGALYLGNTDTTPTVGNARGQLYIASDGDGRTRIQSQATSNKNVELPDATGWIAVGGNGSSSGEGSATKPIYMKTDGTLAEVTSIDSSLYENTDTKVSQTVSSTNSFYPILTKASTATTSVTGGVYFDSKVKLNHSTGQIAVDGNASTSSGSAGGFRINHSDESTVVTMLYKYREATATTPGVGRLLLGNSYTGATNYSGALAIYATTAYCNAITSNAASSSKVNILPNSDGYLAVGSTSGVGAATNPVYMSSSGVLTKVTSIHSSLYNNYYPTTWTWTAGAASGPTAKLTGSGMNDVSVAAIPAASATASGIITTGTQTLAGTKYFGGGSTYYFSSVGDVSCATLTIGKRMVGSYTTAYSTTTSVKNAVICSSIPTGAGVTNQIIFVVT